LFEKNHPNDVLFIVKFAVGSSAVSNTVTPNWDPTTVNGCYQRGKNFFHIPATATLPPGTIEKGLIWMQGEEDANTAANSNQTTFHANTLAVFNAFRTDLSMTTLPIWVCRINNSIARNATYKANVRAVEGTDPGQLCDSLTYPDNHLFDTDSFVPLIDAVHIPQLPYGTALYHEIF
jgi:hypothetical protein